MPLPKVMNGQSKQEVIGLPLGQNLPFLLHYNYTIPIILLSNLPY